jgi:deoxycytidine triphosphate deaminase
MINIGGTRAVSTLTNVDPKDVQPNAVDLRVGKIFSIRNNPFTIDETQKVHRGSDAMIVNTDGYFVLYEGHYEIIMENEIVVAPGEAGFVITRSTLNRNGCFLTSGLYDTGYAGVMAAVLHVNVGRMLIKPGTRVGQYLCFEAESLSLYDGDYGAGKVADARYSDVP